MNPLRWLFVATIMVRICWPANLVISTYLRDGFTPAAIFSDSRKYRIAALVGGCDSAGVLMDTAAVLAQLHHGAQRGVRDESRSIHGRG